MAYGLNIPPMGSCMPHGPVPDVLIPRTPAHDTCNTVNENYGGMAEGVMEQIARMLSEFGFSLKGRTIVYQKPYLEYFDAMPYPHRFRVLDFTRFTGDDARTTYEHVGQFLVQINDVGVTDVHKKSGCFLCHCQGPSLIGLPHFHLTRWITSLT
jgi:hypothetical protein